jgi:aspartyl/asparaginyl-tRNA synthetase
MWGLPLTVFTERKSERFAKFSKEDAGKHVVFRARIHHARAMSKHILFLVFRQNIGTIQGVLTEGETVSQNMLLWAESVHHESVVWVEGVLQIPQNEQNEVKSSSVRDVEVKIEKVRFTPNPASMCNSLDQSCTLWLHQQLRHHSWSKTFHIPSLSWKSNTRRLARPLDSITARWICEHRTASRSSAYKVE